MVFTAMIVFDHVTKKYPKGASAVEDLCFTVKQGETLILLGRSGCGKTTALRLINRLIEPTSGIIYLKGEDILTLDPIDLRRHIGYAIQHIGLFLHMTIEENIGIVPRLLGWPETKVQKRVDELLSAVGLEPKKYRDLYPGKLSGGQKQRIGVARALAADPPIILMDEPFGALDPLMREQLQNEFLQIQSQIQKTILFVTHDLNEAVKMGDRIAILDKGKLLQIATPNELINQPANDFIDQFFEKDRLHLLMQTKTLETLASKIEQKPAHDSPCISIKSSVMEALIKLKQKQVAQLAIYDGETYIGQVSRKQLVTELIEGLQ